MADVPRSPDGSEDVRDGLEGRDTGKQVVVVVVVVEEGEEEGKSG